jgi:AraC-like DNA-binding protein
MNTIDILLIIICGAGLIHGLTVSIYFKFIKSKRTQSDVLLAILLLLMAFRIGKSIVLQFSEDLELLFIFLGLSMLLLIGPILYGYVHSLLRPNFKIHKYTYLHGIPFLFVITLSPFLSEHWFVENGKHWAYILLIGIYIHLAFYIGAAAMTLYRFNKTLSETKKTKPQESIRTWLRYVLIGITFIWISYTLNIFEDQVPYITGPLVYSVSIYMLTFAGYKLKIHTLTSKSFETTNESSLVYQEIITVLERDDIFMHPDISLNKLGDLTGHSKHIISASINTYAQMNFNSLINFYRVQKAKEILSDQKSLKYTISSIAYDTGFNSLSSFNAAFKKFEKITPSNYRNTIIH